MLPKRQLAWKQSVDCLFLVLLLLTFRSHPGFKELETHYGKEQTF